VFWKLFWPFVAVYIGAENVDIDVKKKKASRKKNNKKSWIPHQGHQGAVLLN
jgi:hypothetical protein